jgi:methylase of polypeptide subunit release factors
MTSVQSTEPAQWATEPFNDSGRPEQFAALREWLTAIGYTESDICAATGTPTVAELKSLEAGREVFREPNTPQAALVQLYLDCLRLPWATVRSVIPEEPLANLLALGLLQSAVADPGLAVAPISLCPSEKLWVASDRLSSMETIGDGVPSDLVYSPLTQETRRFVMLMPRTPCDDYLEMCAGTGIAALHAAKGFARYAYSADITERSTRFARFNAALNGIENFAAVQGDMYEPVSGKMFDAISAHPPYVPAEETEMVFRDGGEDGEQITRRVLAGLADYLRPGGLFYLDCMMTDRKNDPIERRTRRMLGPLEDEFDVLVIRTGDVDTKTYQADRLQTGRMTPEGFVRQNALFRALEIEKLVGVTTLIQRRKSPRPVFTRQRTLTKDTVAEDLLWLLRYLTATVEWGSEEIVALLDTKPRALPFAQLKVRSVLRDGGWKLADSRVETTAPFATASPCPNWFAAFLARCDGKTTVREHRERLQADGIMPPTTSPEDFAQMIFELSEVPFIELEQFPLPVVRKKPGGVA